MFIDTWHWKAQANLLLQVQVSCSQDKRNCFFLNIENHQLPVILGSILLKVKQLVWKMRQEIWNVPFTSHHFLFQPYTSYSIQDSGTLKWITQILALPISDLCNTVIQYMSKFTFLNFWINWLIYYYYSMCISAF